MSFVRVPRRSQSLSSRIKKTKKKKPTWDNTTSDLTVHKLSKDELDRRHAVHQSTNLDIIKEEKRRKALIKAKKERSLSEGNQAGLLREILYDEKQLNDALAHSDRVMSVVKDLFYDDPKRLKAVPHITRAPGGDAERRRAGPISEKGPHTSYLDVLSESVMDPSALNEYQDEDSDSEEEETDDEDDEGETPVFDSKMDVNRFQNYIHRAAEQPHEKGERIQPKHHSNKENMDPTATPEKSPLATKQQKALNNTAKAKKKMRSRSKAKSQSSLLDMTQKTNPEDLRMYLNELMTACSAFDRTRGDEQSSDVSHSFSSSFPQLRGYTAFLVQTLTKILKHLSESETQFVQEREGRRKLEQEMAQQRQIIDAMTVDIMQSQELNMKIQAEARKQIHQMEQRLQIVEHLLANREFSVENVLPPTARKDKEDVPEQGPPLSQDQVSKPLTTASTTATVHSTNTSQNRTVQQTDVNPGTTPVTSSAPISLPATLTQPTLPSDRTRHVSLAGGTAYKPSTSQIQSTEAKSLVNPREVLKGSKATGHPVSTGHQVPQLSQHTMERLMTSRPIQGKGNVHIAGNLRNMQTNVPSGIQSSGLLQSGDVRRAVAETASTSTFGVSSVMSSSAQKGNDSTSLGNSISTSRTGAFISSSQQKKDAFGTSPGQHLRPIQPAMLLSPPRQKDRRDFIKPPGYQSQSIVSAPYSLAPGGITATSISSNLSGGTKASTHHPKAVSFGNRSQFPGFQSHPVRSNDPTSQSRHPPQHPLLNNYTSSLDGQKEGAPSIVSMDSTSTRYHSLPGDYGETNVIKNILHQVASENTTGHYQPHAQPGRVGPNGQDHHQQQSSRNVHPVTMDTVYEASVDGTVEPGGENTSVDLNEKIALLSRQRVEAQARLEQLKDVYCGESSVSAPQRPTTSGGEATDHRVSAKHTGVLIGASPPVSPITRESPSQRPIPTGTSHVVSEGRTIHVSMPKLSELEISATSTPASKRTSIGSGSPSPSINQSDWKTPIKGSPGKEQFFALKAHIST